MNKCPGNTGYKIGSPFFFKIFLGLGEDVSPKGDFFGEGGNKRQSNGDQKRLGADVALKFKATTVFEKINQYSFKSKDYSKNQGKIDRKK